MADTKVYLSGGRIQGASTDTTPASFTPTGNISGLRYLVVGGGAGAGTNNGGGGGSGGTVDSTLNVTAGTTYNITVGAKSIGVKGGETPTNGGDSTFGSVTMNGGGYGGQGGEAGGNSVNGSGGGGGHGSPSSGGTGGGTYGYDGGDGTSASGSGGGGGGGSSAVGANSSSLQGGNGGAGTNSNIYDGSTNVSYGAGGGGSVQGSGSTGGAGGNAYAGTGAATDSNTDGGDATPTDVTPSNSSAGNGGGGGRGSLQYGGDGSDGIVILRFPTSGNAYTIVGGLAATSGSDTLIIFTVGNAVAVDASKTAITNIPAGTRYEETDTRKIFRYKPEHTAEVEDSDGYGTIATNTGSGGSNTSNQKAHDFGSAILGDFVFRWTLTANMGNTGQNGGCAVFLSTNDANYQGAAHDSVVGALGHKHNASNSRGFAWGQGDNTHNSSALNNAQDAIWEAADVGEYEDVAGPSTKGLNIVNTATNYEIERAGTTLTFKIYNSDWSSVNSTRTVTGAATTKYRYVYFAGRHQGDMSASNSYWKVSYTKAAEWVEKGTA